MDKVQKYNSFNTNTPSSETYRNVIFMRTMLEHRISEVGGIAQWYKRWATALNDRGFESRQGLGIFLFATASRPALWPTQPPVQWVPRALSLGVKWPGRKADHSPPSIAVVRECVELYLDSANTPSWRGAHLKHRDNFTASPSYVFQQSHINCRLTNGF
jgi:hypothetical protein